MPKVKISEYSATANSNTDVASINIDEGCAPSGINNAIRAVMGHLKDFQQGTNGDPFNGPVNGTVGATTPSTGAFTTLSASSTVTLSGGTANGVAYLNGSKVLTTGSALSFNGNTFSVNGTSPGVGINDTTATLGVSFSFLNGGAFYSYGQIALRDTTNSQTAYAYSSGASGYHNWFQNGTEKMRLDSSGNLGIGTTNIQERLTVQNNIQITNNASNLSGIYFGTNANPAQRYSYIESDGRSTGYINFNTNALERMRIDSGGKLLLGVTSGTGLSNGDFAMGNGKSIRFRNAADSAYISAFEFTSANGLNIGTGGSLSTITFGISGIGEAGRFDTSGRMIIGNTTMPVGYGTALNVYTTGVGARVYGTTESAGPFWVDKQTNTSSTSQVFVQFTINTQATGNGQINGNGASQVAFGSFSDRRLKENITDLPPQLANIMALRPVEFDYIESEGGGHQTSFIAQEFEEIYPDAIGERADGMKTLTGWGKTEARLVKAIQEQQAIIQSLTARITALEGA